MSDFQAGQDAPVVNDEAAAAAQPSDADLPRGTEPEGQEQESQPEKTYTKAELDELMAKATAKAAAKAERRGRREAAEMLQRQQAPQEQPRQQTPQAPKREHYASEDDWLDARLEHRERVREAQTRQQQEQQQLQAMSTKARDLVGKAQQIESFDQEAFEDLPLTDAMTGALLDLDGGPKVLAYLTANPAEVERIAKLSVYRQTVELGRLEDKLSGTSTSKAPPPINPIGGRGASSSDPNKMTFAEYEKWRNSQGR